MWSYQTLTRKNLRIRGGEAALKTLSGLLLQKPRSLYKGRRYKEKEKRSKGKEGLSLSLDFPEEEVSTGYAEGVNTDSIKLVLLVAKLVLLCEQVLLTVLKVHLLPLIKAKRRNAPMIIENALRLNSTLGFSLSHKDLQKEEGFNEQQKSKEEVVKSVLGSGLQGEDFAKKMVELVNQRKKHFAEERARAKKLAHDSITAENIYDELLEESGDMEAVSAEELKF
ncbi:hypothetical protein Tco_0014541 [Tanacetum coccineum]